MFSYGQSLYTVLRNTVAFPGHLVKKNPNACFKVTLLAPQFSQQFSAKMGSSNTFRQKPIIVQAEIPRTCSSNKMKYTSTHASSPRPTGNKHSQSPVKDHKLAPTCNYTTYRSSPSHRSYSSHPSYTDSSRLGQNSHGSVGSSCSGPQYVTQRTIQSVMQHKYVTKHVTVLEDKGLQTRYIQAEPRSSQASPSNYYRPSSNRDSKRYC
ncbi:hypothetical protein BJ878DRAFT_150915 [Calycina marina]|uniref:Uncharacterized protein n=1 Tax=Calycina marina TaxID=1763456 RepID=A0A9P7ZBY6_9HELO|nr:hypothetical protein BJ878DRAFT_150915 [Calycina marina]